MSGYQITSSSNEMIKEIVRLRERRERDVSGRLLIEGYRELRRALDAKWPIEQILYSPSLFLGCHEDALLKEGAVSGAKLFSCHPDPFRKASYRDRPDGLIAVARQRKPSLREVEHALRQRGAPALLVLAEAIEKPGNLGTILRSADGAGASGVLVCDRCTDIYNPNVVRSSVGTLFTQPVVEVGSREALDWCKSMGIRLLAATPHATTLYTEADLRAPLAIAVGTEQLGLSEALMKGADVQVSIPMRGVADSLNVATATVLLLYEALRQRAT